MQKLISRLEEDFNLSTLSHVKLYTWERSSDVIYCSKGICIFLQINTHDEMYKDLRKLFEEKVVI